MAPGWRKAIDYCAQPKHLRRTLRIAFVVGLVLTAINQLDVILGRREVSFGKPG
jgi:hypothetical protein